LDPLQSIDHLDKFTQRLQYGHDFTLGYTLRSKSIKNPTLSFIFALGIFRYNHTHWLCRPGVGTIVIEDFTPCTEIKQRDFGERVTRSGIGINVHQNLLTYKSFNLGASITPMLNIVSSNSNDMTNFLNQNNQSYIIPHQEPEWGGDNILFILHGLPKSRVVKSDDQVLIPTIRLGLWLRYTIN